jgi:SAM-dependent methyltransferase
MTSDTMLYGANPFDVDLDQVRDYYSERLKYFGASPKGVDWGSEQRQQRRFQELSACFVQDDDFSILDLGCGYGAFLDHLKSTGKRAYYTGRDLSEDMIAQARQLQPGANFIAGSLGTEDFDYIIASGIFNIMRASTQDKWQDYVLHTITEMFEHSKKACGFNFLTSYSDEAWKKTDLYYADPKMILDFCIRNLSMHVNLSHHYGAWDFTVLVRREDP